MPEDAGTLLVRAGLIDESELDEARAARAQRGGSLAEHLVLAGYVDDEELTAFYRNRLLVPRVAAADLATLAKSVVDRLPEDMAVELRSVPIMSDREGNLTVAMSDPADSRAVDEIAFFTGSYVVRAVATQAQIAWCLAHYYGCVTPLYENLLQQTEGAAHDTPPAAGAPFARRPAAGSITGRVAAMRHPVVPPGADLQEQRRPTEEKAAAAPERATTADDKDSGERVGSARTRERFDTGETQPMKTIPEPQVPAAVGADGSPAHARGAGGRKPPPDTDETRPLPTMENRLLAQQPSPPELAARSGVFEARSLTDAEDGDSGELPPVIVDYSKPRGEAGGAREEPILLTKRSGDSVPIESGISASAGVPQAVGDEPIMLVRSRKRSHKPTSLGLGNLGGLATVRPPPLTRPERRPSGQPPAAEHSGVVSNAIEDATEPTGAPAMPPPSSIDDSWGSGEDLLPPTGPIRAPGAAAGKSGTRPGQSSDGVPLESDSNGLLRTQPMLVPLFDQDVGNQSPLESEAATAPIDRSTQHVAETASALNQAHTRDEVVHCVLTHLTRYYRQAAFVALRRDHLLLWRSRVGSDIRGPGSVSLPIDGDSTFAGVVRAALPYFGPLDDHSSRAVIAETLADDDGECLLLPVAVRGRMVGVLYGGICQQPPTEEHLGVILRAVSTALERIVMESKQP